MSSDAIPDQHRRLADALEAAEAEGAEVDGVESFTVDGELVATVDVGIDAVQEDSDEDESEAVTGEDAATVDDATEELEDTDQTAEDIADQLEEVEAEQEGDVVDADASTVDPADEPAPSTPSESDIAPGDIEDEVEEGEGGDDGPDRWGPPKVTADDADEEGEDAVEDTTEDDSPVEDGTLESKVLAALREEGELTASELEEITGAGNVHHPLSVLAEDDLVEKRQDPNDGRRKLYRPAGWLVDEDQDEEEDVDDGPAWNGRDPEEIVADSSLPARVVLEDILDAVAAADTVIDVAEDLDVDVDNLSPVCWKLTLKNPDSLTIVDDVDERVETIREVVEA